MTKEEVYNKYIPTPTVDNINIAMDEYTKQQCIAFIEWGFKDDNPFVEGSNGRWIQQCGNSTSWSSEQLYQLFIQQNENK